MKSITSKISIIILSLLASTYTFAFSHGDERDAMNDTVQADVMDAVASAKDNVSKSSADDEATLDHVVTHVNHAVTHSSPDHESTALAHSTKAPMARPPQFDPQEGLQSTCLAGFIWVDGKCRSCADVADLGGWCEICGKYAEPPDPECS
jgi:hypothetical protein